MAGENLMAELRSESIKIALSLATPDAVYEIVRFNEWSMTDEYKIPLEELLPKDCLPVLIEWQKKSYLLRSVAYAVGDAGLRNDGSYELARKRFEEANPGFDERSYKSAVSYGYQMAR
jgi:hypothetical protein